MDQRRATGRRASGRRTPRGAGRDARSRSRGGRFGNPVQGAERRVHGESRVRHRGECQLPCPRALDLLAAVHDGRRGRQHAVRNDRDAGPDLSVARDPGGHPAQHGRVVPAEESCDHHDPGVISHWDHRVIVHI